MFDYENADQEELVRWSRRGDVKAFSALYAQIYQDLYRFAFYMTKHPQDAEDAVSDAVISAFENMRLLKKEQSFRSWIFTILNHQCKKAVSRRKRERKKMLQGREPEEASNPDYARWHDVRKAFDLLDEEEKVIVAFSVFGGYKSEEIALLLNRNAATVRSRKSRALDKMRKALC